MVSTPALQFASSLPLCPLAAVILLRIAGVVSLFTLGAASAMAPPMSAPRRQCLSRFLYISRRLQMHFTVDSRLAWHQPSFFKRSDHVNFKHCCRRSTFVAPRQSWRRCRFILNEFQAAASARPFLLPPHTRYSMVVIATTRAARVKSMSYVGSLLAKKLCDG